MVERSPGPCQKLDQVPSSRCFDRIQFAEGRRVVSSRTPRNSRSSRSSASIVTLVSSSPFHQPAGSWSDSRCSAARSRRVLRGAGRSSVGIARTLIRNPSRRRTRRRREARRPGPATSTAPSSAASAARRCRSASLGPPPAARSPVQDAHGRRHVVLGSGRRRTGARPGSRRRHRAASACTTGSVFLCCRRSFAAGLPVTSGSPPDAEEVVDRLEGDARRFGRRRAAPRPAPGCRLRGWLRARRRTRSARRSCARSSRRPRPR